MLLGPELMGVCLTAKVDGIRTDAIICVTIDMY